MLEKLPFDEFLKTFKYVPRLAVCILAFDNNNRFLLSKRTEDPEEGFWHYPGCFLLKGEKIESCIKRLARDELGVSVKYSDISLIGIFENLKNDRRGHVVDIIYKIKLESKAVEKIEKSKNLKFFEKLPRKIGFGHKKILLSIAGH